MPISIIGANIIEDDGEITYFKSIEFDCPEYFIGRSHTRLIYLSDELFIFLQYIYLNNVIIVVYFRDTKKVNVFSLGISLYRTYYVSGKILSDYYIYDLEGNLLKVLDDFTYDITNILWYKTKLIGFVHNNNSTIINLYESIVEVTISDSRE